MSLVQLTAAQAGKDGKMGRRKKNQDLDSSVAVMDNGVSESQNSIGEKKMSKTEEKTEAVTAETAKKKIRFYDLTTFELKEKEVPLSFTPAASYEEGFARLQASLNDDAEALRDAVNTILREKEFAAQKRQAIGDNGASKKIVLDQIKNWRDVPPFDAIVTTEKGKDGWKPQYDKQTAAILEQAKDVPFVVNAIKAKAAKDTSDDSDES
jgi:hypothetical protein